MHKTILLLNRLIGDGRRYVPAFVVIGAINLVLVPIELGALLLSRRLIDEGFLQQDWLVVRSLMITLILLFLLHSCIAFGTALFSMRLQLLINRKFQDRIFAHLIVLPMRILIRQPVGRLMSRILDDGTRLSSIYDQLFGAAILNPVKLLVLAVLLMSFNLKLFAVLMIASMISLCVIHWVGNRMDAISKKMQAMDATLFSYAEEMLANVELVKSKATEGHTAATFRGFLDRLMALSLRIHRITLIARPVQQILKFSAIAAVLLIGSWMISRGSLSLGTLTIFSGTTLLFFNALNGIGNTYGRLRENLARLEAVYQLLDTAPEQLGHREVIPKPERVETIRFNDVHFGYRAAVPVLKGVSLAFRRGDMVGITGQSGSGKTTLVRLLMRFYSPASGTIDVNGTALEGISITDWRASVGIVFQENLILNDSIRNNITYGIHKPIESRMIRAARISGIHEFVHRLPEGYDTLVGESGRWLSGGQRQRLAIARAIVSEPDVLILDEATSYLEVDQEAAILGRLRDSRRDKITILVSHRPSAIQLVDRVLILDQGRLIDVDEQQIYGMAGKG